ncbi:TrmB family transcriptional regulator [Halocatena halophila]|uniref:TrmB family transcriptional regulator n=1 Tax=Halocatena halophila TaxID=2814576 RepID=UPI002ECFC03E
MNDIDLEMALERFGFSEKEVATYLVIINHGQIKVSALAKKADISVRYAYNVAERLERRGLVMVNDYVTPTMIRAVSPSDSISQLKDELSTIESELDSRFEENRFEHQVEVLKTQSTLFKRIRENIRTADKEIILSIPARSVSDFADDLRGALDRGVFIVLLVTGSETMVSEIDTIASIVRTWDEDAPVLMAVDSWKGIISPPDMFRRINSHKHGIRLREYQLTPILISAFLGNYWRCGSEVYLTRSMELPHEYTAWRHAVFDATCLLKQEATLHAEIKVRSVSAATGFETVAGRVVETRQAIIDPSSGTLPIENTLFIAIDGDVYSVGGPGAFLEEYEAKMIRLTA